MKQLISPKLQSMYELLQVCSLIHVVNKIAFLPSQLCFISFNFLQTVLSLTRFCKIVAVFARQPQQLARGNLKLSDT